MSASALLLPRRQSRPRLALVLLSLLLLAERQGVGLQLALRV